MKKKALLMLLVWWFAVNVGSTVTAIGPFSDEETCNKIRAQIGSWRWITSCWSVSK